MLKIDGVTILGLEIELYGEKTQENEIDLGALTLRNEGREYILDAVKSYITTEGGFTTIEVELEKDEETFSDCKYDLQGSDLENGMDAEFYISSDLNVEYITLFVKSGDCTKAIDVKQE